MACAVEILEHGSSLICTHQELESQLRQIVGAADRWWERNVNQTIGETNVPNPFDSSFFLGIAETLFLFADNSEAEEVRFPGCCVATTKARSTADGVGAPASSQNNSVSALFWSFWVD